MEKRNSSARRARQARLAALLLVSVPLAWALPTRTEFKGSDGLPVDAPAIPVRMVTPEYPRLALRKALGGRTVACFTISSAGRVRDAVVVESSNDLFASPTLKAVKKSTFKPARRGNQTVASELCRTYRFSLERLSDY